MIKDDRIRIDSESDSEVIQIESNLNKQGLPFAMFWISPNLISLEVKKNVLMDYINMHIAALNLINIIKDNRIRSNSEGDSEAIQIESHLNNKVLPLL